MAESKRLTPNYLTRVLPSWATPAANNAETWRKAVRKVPACIDCRDVLIQRLLALPWEVAAKSTSEQAQYAEECAYYAEVFGHANNQDMGTFLDLLWQDALDLPIGGNAEVVRDAQGRVVQLYNLDGATLDAMPTRDGSYVLRQRMENQEVILTPQDVHRIGISPRPEFTRIGWYMAPPEKVYLALELIARGDKYYANLLLDTPPAGILSLGDMEKKSAEDWVIHFRELFTGVDPFKIPVLYEIKETQPQWIPFTKPPTELMFQQTMLSYQQLVCAAYGITTGDIGVGEPQTLAGSIRQDRSSRETGFAVVQAKTEAFFNALLPPYLQFQFHVLDTESLTILGRARLANFQAFRHLRESGLASVETLQNQARADGLITVDFVGDPAPPDRVRGTEAQIHPPDVLRKPEPASEGGRGDQVGKGRWVGKSLPIKVAYDTVELEDILHGYFEDVRRRADDRRVKALLKRHAMATDDEDSEDRNGALDEELDKDPWWKTGLKAAAVIAALIGAYEWGARQMAERLERERTGDEGSRLDLDFRLRNELALATLEAQAATMVRNVDDGTRYYLKRMIAAGFNEGKSAEEIAARIRAGENMERILDDGAFLTPAMASVQADLAAMATERVKDIAAFEIRSATESSGLEMMVRAGLTRKHWSHVGHTGGPGPCPCPVCAENDGLGWVPIEYEYPTAFEDSTHPPCHPSCHCGLEFDGDEVRGREVIRYWNGD